MRYSNCDTQAPFLSRGDTSQIQHRKFSQNDGFNKWQDRNEPQKLTVMINFRALLVVSKSSERALCTHKQMHLGLQKENLRRTWRLELQRVRDTEVELGGACQFGFSIPPSAAQRKTIW